MEMKKNYLFYLLSVILVIGLFSFHYWLAYPGYSDWESMHHLTLSTIGWKGVFITYCLRFLGYLFGQHIYFMLLMNFIPVYIGILILMITCYRRFRSYFSLCFLLFSFIRNIFFGMFYLSDTHIMGCSLFLLYALCIYGVLTPPKHKITTILYYISFLVTFCFSLFSRYNAMAFVLPVCIFICYQVVSKYHLRKKAIVALSFGSVIITLLLSLSTGLPRLIFLGEEHSHPVNHIFLHQIAGACVPANDSSCFNSFWYKGLKNFEDVKKVYHKDPLNADSLSGFVANSIFKTHILIPDLSLYYIRGIIRYPGNYLKHIYRFLVKNTKLKYVPIDNREFSKMEKHRHSFHHKKLLGMYPFSETQISLTKTQEKIYQVLHYLPVIHPAYSLVLCFLLVIGFYCFLSGKYDKPLSVIMISSSCSTLLGFLICSIFSPLPLERYIYGIVFSTGISFITLILIYCMKRIKVHH